MSKTQSSETNKASRVGIIIVIVLILLVALVGGFFWYVRSCRLFPDMGGFGADHYASEDHCGLYTYGVNDDITASERTETSKPVLTGAGKLESESVRVDTTSYQKYALLPCDQPVDVSLVFDADSKLCCTELVYHYTDEELGNFEQDMETVTKAVKKSLAGNPITALYSFFAEKLGMKQYQVIKNVTVDDTQLIVLEYYSTKAYN